MRLNFYTLIIGIFRSKEAFICWFEDGIIYFSACSSPYFILIQHHLFLVKNIHILLKFTIHDDPNR